MANELQSRESIVSRAARGIPKLLRALEAVLSWLFSYPIMPLCFLLYYLVALARLRYCLGADDLFWSESSGEQFWNGLAVGLLFGEIFLVRYLLDPNRSGFSAPATLFPVWNEAIRELGQYLFLLWVPSLFVFALKLASRDYREGHINPFPLLGGLACSVILAMLLVVLMTQWSSF